MQYKLDVNSIKARCQGRWGYVFTSLADASLMDAWDRGTKHGPCPIHGGNEPFRFFRDADHTGGAICSTCGSFGDGFSLLSIFLDKPFFEVLKAVNEVLDGASVSVPQRAVPAAVSLKQKLQQTANRNMRQLNRLMKTLTPVERNQSRIAAYLGSRSLFPELNSQKDCYFGVIPFYEREGDNFTKVGDFPAMVWLLRDEKGDVVSAHRTYLDPQGAGKLPKKDSRKLIGCIRPKGLSGSAIRIGEPQGGVLGIAEGIETAMAVTQMSGETCWSAISAALLSNFEVPEGVTTVNIYADLDVSGAGQRAGKSLAKRLHAQGYRVDLRLPNGEIPAGEKALDFADLVSRDSSKKVM